MQLHVGLDVGSTTVKVICREEDRVIFSVYRRHKSDVKKTVRQVLKELQQLIGDRAVTMAVTGSGGMILEDLLGIPFVQEVVAETQAIRERLPHTEVIIELGGEDSKITYLAGNVEQRMNSICAGGTGAFIDQMANLLDTDASGLNRMAERAKKIYPIASRCGVFAKTDIQALLNDGAEKEDIALSVFQSVVNQTISNLACGRPIHGNITFLGGPLHFLSHLRDRFVATLDGEENTFTTPEDGQLFVAYGASLLAESEGKDRNLDEILKRLDLPDRVKIQESRRMDPLFADPEDYRAFVEDHKCRVMEYGKLQEAQGPLYLGIDAGSTTAKMVLIDRNRRILYTHYSANKGKPLEHVMEHLKELYDQLPAGAYIANSGITGYGEDFIRAALDVDFGEVETIAHYRAARYFNPNVDFILDIGGQDMKAMHIRDGVIDSIQLNEACSSGCGSFLSTFAASVSMDVAEFQQEALFAKAPVDLGSRCTVFMNSKVKQAQKEGAELGDIAAGLCYSVIRNAIYKVIKVRDPQKLGRELVVQGGTFYGDAILRAFERLTGRKATRPAIAGLMGAMGMALLAQERSRGHSTLKSRDQLERFSYLQRSAHCGGCTNNCALTINIFSDGSRYISGNRCERGAGGIKRENGLPNLYAFKYQRLFDYYQPLDPKDSPYPVVGIPRVLNMYEDYPFWHRFFTAMGFSVRLSDESSRDLYDRGLASISSETVCYPGKLVHGHIENLVDKGIRLIFYPDAFYETKEFGKADNQVNCPVVCGFPEVIKNNVSSLEDKHVTYLHPFLSFKNPKTLKKALAPVFAEFAVDGHTYHIDKRVVDQAVEAGWQEMEQFREEIRLEGHRALQWMKEHDKKGIVLAGRPYHLDPEVNHGIPELLNGMGIAVLSEDSVLGEIQDLSEETRVLDQWVYHSRLYRAAEFVAGREDLELIQLNSFGCGLDAVTTDQVQEILRSRGKIYTLLKIDEVSNLGAIKIRVRSLMQALDDPDRPPLQAGGSYTIAKKVFTKKMFREKTTILVPAMAPDHFQILQAALKSEGYEMDFLETVNRKIIDTGLKYVNNDSCYPSITVVGQMMAALESGKYDPDHVALLMTQTGGACRASNYVGYIRKALKDAGYSQVPVIALSAQGIETSPGFHLSLSAMNKALYSVLLGDLVMRVSNATRPYEDLPGKTDRKKQEWIQRFRSFVEKPSRRRYKKLVQECVDDFDHQPRMTRSCPKAGIVGEILVKYLPEANNHLRELLEAEGAEVMVPDLTDFLLYCLRNATHKSELFGASKSLATLCRLCVGVIEHYRKPIRNALALSQHFEPPLRIEQIEQYASEIVSLGNQYGEGWLLTGEMIELIRAGAPNIVCIQPFGCLPNHITGKGVMKAIRNAYEEANIIAVDYDPGASEVNQVNRVKLMMSSAREKLEKTKKTAQKAGKQTDAKKASSMVQ